MRGGLQAATSSIGVASFRSRVMHGVGFAWAVAALALAACAGAPKGEPAFDARLASNIDASAKLAAVAKPGTKVCRYIPLGIAEKDLIRGVVQQSEGDS